jgi:hypothetical protein
MTQEHINKIFLGDLGQQLNSIFTTSDDRCFIRYEEAKAHTEGKLDPDTLPLDDKTIIEWWDENDYMDEPTDYSQFQDDKDNLF